MSLETPTTQADGLSSSDPFSPSHCQSPLLFSSHFPSVITMPLLFLFLISLPQPALLSASCLMLSYPKSLQQLSGNSPFPKQTQHFPAAHALICFPVSFAHCSPDFWSPPLSFIPSVVKSGTFLHQASQKAKERWPGAQGRGKH